jgi:nucleoside phosphorylase
VANVFVGFRRAYRQIEAPVTRPVEVAGPELVGRHWATMLCHVEDPSLVEPMIANARGRGVALDLLVCPERGFTTPKARAAAAAVPGAVRLGGIEPLIVIGGRMRFQPPEVDPVGSPRGITILLFGSMVILGLEAVVITFLERGACVPACGRLTSYPNALYWLFSRLVFLGDPAGLAPHAAGTKVIGLLTPVAGAVLAGSVGVATWRHVARRSRAVRDAYAELARRQPTVGVLTAVPDEYNAMLALLEESTTEWPAPDGVLYVFGRLPSLVASTEHEVVLAMTTEAGTGSAAAACTKLTTAFPSVDCVIVTGTAAGVPRPDQPDKHVRLGDVVVGTWGVVDYDHVDQTPDGPRPRGGFPRLSRWLTRAAHDLEAAEQRGQRPWEQWLDTSVTSSLDRHERPSADTDVLYASDESGRTLLHPDPARSGHRPGWPKVHYGAVASANRSLRDARIRDEVASRHDVRAIEMEASGIGTAAHEAGVDWFVVRGISDYADSRTTRTWRPYAALAAAAYVRALLAAARAIEQRQSRPDALVATGGVADGVDPASSRRARPTLRRLNFLRLLILVFVVLVSISIVVQIRAASEPTPVFEARVRVTPEAGPAGTMVILNAYGFLVSEMVDIVAVTPSGQNYPLASRGANANGDVRGFPVRIDRRICCPGTIIHIRATGRLSAMAGQVGFSLT